LFCHKKRLESGLLLQLLLASRTVSSCIADKNKSMEDTGPNHFSPNLSKLSKLLQTSPNFSKLIQFFGELWKIAIIDLGAFLRMYLFSRA
jgi:hypothetical protein